MSIAKRIWDDVRENVYMYFWTLVAVLALLIGVTNGQNPRLIQGDMLAAYKSVAPQTDEPLVQEVIDHPDTWWYNTSTMGVWYQAWRSESLQGTFSAFRNVDLNRPQDPFGNANREYPWAPTLGGGSFDRDFRPRLKTAKLILRPETPDTYRGQVGDRLPIATFGAAPTRWLFPHGTRIVEAAWLADAKHWRPMETRFRMREPDDWQTDRLDPIGTRDDLVAAVAQTHPEIAEQIPHGKITKVDIHDNHPIRAINSDAVVQNLPDFPPELVNRILSQTQRSMAGEDYAPGIDRPTTESAYHIRPKGDLTANHGNGSRESCRQCHRDIHKHTRRDIEPNRGWYGNVRGSDGILSFYPHREFVADGSVVRFVDLPEGLKKYYTRSVFLETEMRRAGMLR